MNKFGILKNYPYLYGMDFLFIIILVYIYRYIRFQKFYRKVVDLCQYHDKVLSNNNKQLKDIISKPKYYLTEEWSALNFVFFKGPNPVIIFLSLRSLDIYKIYGNTVIDRLYDNIERKLQ